MPAALVDIGSRFSRALTWTVVWAFATVGATFVIAAGWVLLHGTNSYTGVVIFFGSFIVGGVFLGGALMVSPIIILIMTLTTVAGGCDRWIRLLFGSAWAALAIVAAYGFRQQPMDINLISDLFVPVIFGGAVGGWIADRVACRHGFVAEEPRLFLPVLALLAISLTTVALWNDRSADRYHKITFQLLYHDKPVALTSTFHCDPFFESAPRSNTSWVDVNRNTASFTLPDGKAAILQFETPCRTDPTKPAFRDSVRLMLLDDVAKPTQIALYDQASVRRPDSDAPWLSNVTVTDGSEADRKAALVTEVGRVMYSGYGWNDGSQSKVDGPLFHFIVVRARLIPGSEWRGKRGFQFLDGATTPLFRQITNDLAVETSRSLDWKLPDWSYYDLANRAMVPPIPANLGVTRGQLNHFDTEKCIRVEVLRAISEAAWSALPQNGRCDDEVYFFDPDKQSLIVLGASMYTYIPTEDRSRFPGAAPEPQ